MPAMRNAMGHEGPRRTRRLIRLRSSRIKSNDRNYLARRHLREYINARWRIKEFRPGRMWLPRIRQGPDPPSKGGAAYSCALRDMHL